MKILLALLASLLISPSALASSNDSSCDMSKSVCWIKVLIAEYEPPADTSTYVNDIYTLAPNLDEFHVRVKAGSDPKVIADTIKQLKAKYGDALQMGYHPDLSKSKDSYKAWGCAGINDTKKLNTCMVTAAAKKFNAIEAKGGQFDILSLEQSYIITGHGKDANDPTGKMYNGCFNHGAGNACPSDSALTNTSVKIGNVLSASSGIDPSIYSTDQLQYGYPQLYNIYQEDMQMNLKFPTFLQDYKGASASLPSEHSNLVVVDACINEAACHSFTKKHANRVVAPKPIEGLNNSYSYGNPLIVAAHVGWIAPRYFSVTIPPEANVTWMLSGEPEFFGAPDNIDRPNKCKFDAKTMNAFYSTLIPAALAACAAQGKSCDDLSKLRFGIWNFSNLLRSNECGAMYE
ncbi:MAG: hypothetical protein P1U40_12525 [Coxiellaceae bacterium]|nr:hypothetical protein [Coxiellaceae bacterium]